ncbi:hypothetical protein DY000_02022019 [Brassica cretica]|uniref:Aspartic peptidase DDI1-type domain-containing protein n=1 Tax=Brassica cretica TaxID=69181 RepID=A0ABQ7E0Y1_BRACR|nr:hypothetical protein DY000_02022019 [Brassica cretica]
MRSPQPNTLIHPKPYASRSRTSIDIMSQLPIDRKTLPTIDTTHPTSIDDYLLPTELQLLKIDVARLNALRQPSQPSENIADNFSQQSDNFSQQSDDAPESMQVDQTSQRKTLRRSKEKVPNHLKRGGVNEKEMDSFTKRVLRTPLDKPFEEAYFTHRLWMFFRVTKETEQDIHRVFNQIRVKMKHRITLKKKSDPGKFAVPCLVEDIEFPCALCDTGSSVSILPKVMADHLGLKIEPSEDSFTFVDYSTRNSRRIIRDLEVQTDN